MRRVLLVGLLLPASSLVACGDDPEAERAIAFLRTSPIAPESQESLLDALDDAGWRVGDNLTLLNEDPEAVFAEDELADAVDGLVADGADLLIALSTAAASAAMDSDDDVPVLVVANDPVASGLVVEPRTPVGVVTGIAFHVPADRTIDLARQLVGDEGVLGLLHPDDDRAAAPVVDDMGDAAAALGVRLVDERFIGEDGARDAIGRLVQAGVDAIILVNAPGTIAAHEAIEEATVAARLPTIANTNVNRFAVVVLAPDNVVAFRQLGRQAARLLDGAEVDEVPLEEPGEFNLIVRAGVADRLGIELPDELLEQADEVSD